MSTLLVDIGNTRVKWATFTRRRVGRMKAATRAGWDGERIARRVIRGAPKPLERIVVVSVAGARVDRAFAAEVRRRVGIATEFFRSTRSAGGVTTRYLEPWRLGADRLAGVIGAFHLSKHRPVCVVSIGTTMTLDFVDADGRHLGGAIVPSPPLMVDSLLWGTHGIRRRARGGLGSRGLFARSTRSAIAEGARHAVAAVADRAAFEARLITGRTPLVLLTGGAALSIAGLIRTRHRYVPDLVLQGLAVIASARPS